MSMPDLLQGPIAVEYGEIALTIRADKEGPGKSTGDSCGSDCTTPADCQKGTLPNDSCPVIPGREKKYQAFTPALPGWSEPPATGI